MPTFDLTGHVVRALTLYALAEFQGGHATALALRATGNAFSVSDNGRGHGIDRTVNGVRYLDFIYNHFDYPFDSTRGGEVQLQGIGMSLINSLCSELRLTVRKPLETLTLTYRAGLFCAETRLVAANEESGNTVEGEVRSELQRRPTDQAQLEQWLLRIQQSNLGLELRFNGRLLLAAA